VHVGHACVTVQVAATLLLSDRCTTHLVYKVCMLDDCVAVQATPDANAAAAVARVTSVCSRCDDPSDE
jgi:hypothetical protein